MTFTNCSIFSCRRPASIWYQPTNSLRYCTMAVNPRSPPHNLFDMLSVVWPKPKNRLSIGSRYSHASSLAKLMGTCWANIEISSDLLALGRSSILSITFSSVTRTLTTCISIVGAILDTPVALLACGPDFKTVVVPVNSMAYAITRGGVRTVGGTRAFGCVVKKSWSQCWDCWWALAFFFFSRLILHALLTSRLCCFKKFCTLPMPTLISLLQAGHRTFPSFTASW